MDNASLAHNMKTIFQLGVQKSSHEHGCHGHLRPLSVYARTMASCRNDQSYETTNHAWGNRNPSNLERKEKVTSSESTSKKRRLDDSCLDDTYETPDRKVWKPQNTVSPDQAWVRGSWTLLPEPQLGSYGPKTGSSAGMNTAVDHEKGRTPAGSGLMVQHVKSERSDGRQAGMLPGSSHPNPAESGVEEDPAESGVEEDPAESGVEEDPAESGVEGVTEDQDTASDNDIDGSMCLSPINSDSSYDSMDDFISSCLIVYEQSISHKKDSGHSVLRQSLIGSSLECQVEEVTVETSYENTLPLQVQMRSVVVVPNLQINKAPPLQSQIETQSPPQPTEVPRKVTYQHKGSNTKYWKATKSRPVVYDTEQVWQQEKRLYMDSVSHHMKESVGEGQGVISELVNLMDRVADQGPDLSGQLWQHPSDLTSRNYKQCFGTDVKRMTLDQWTDQSFRNHKRFVTVPKVFKRNTKY